MPASTASAAPRMHALDGVRAVAASLVVLHHLGIASNSLHGLSDAGYRVTVSLLDGITAGGVELFFVLSGVVLARPYVRGGRQLNAVSYFSRRVQRLFPAFLVAWLLSGLSIYLVSKYPTWWTPTAYLPAFDPWDWLYQVGIVYWGSKPYNFAWWSLSTEVLFYLVVPLLIPFFRHVGESRPLLIAAWGASLLASLYAFAYPVSSVLPIEKLLVYSSCFCEGMLLAAVDFSPLVRLSAALVGAAWVVCASYLETLNPHVGWGLLAFALVASASEHRAVAEKILSKPLFVWLGERSYSIFLTHLAVIVLVYNGVSALLPRGIPFFLATRLLVIVLTLLTGMLLFHFVERRFARSLITANAFWPWSVLRGGKEVFAGVTNP